MAHQDGLGARVKVSARRRARMRLWFKDRDRADAQARPLLTACDAAWREPAAQNAVRRWLTKQTRSRFEWMMPGMIARFERAERRIDGVPVTVATDGENPRTVYACCPARRRA